MKILYKITSRSRPQKLLNVINNIKSHAILDDYVILCSLDEDDQSINPIKETLKNFEKVICYYGISKSKVDAINRDMDKITDWDILFNVSDDQLFLKKGFDKMVIDKVKEVGGDCFLHYPDRNVKHLLSTMSIMDKKYYQRFNYIYHPSYISLWCDNEAMEVAKKLNRYFYTDDQIFDHYHPAYGKAPNDAQYLKTESYYKADKITFDHRKKINFPK
jgi:hypothetical protein